MSTAFASIVSAMVTQLQAAPAVSAQVHRARLRPMAKEWPDAIVVRPLQTELMPADGQNVVGIWTTSVAVECYARALASVSPDVAVDSILQAVITRLLANRSLGGLVGDVIPSAITYDFDVDGETTACATITFSIRHATAANSITPH